MARLALTQQGLQANQEALGGRFDRQVGNGRRIRRRVLKCLGDTLLQGAFVIQREERACSADELAMRRYIRCGDRGPRGKRLDWGQPKPLKAPRTNGNSSPAVTFSQSGVTMLRL